MLLTVAPIWDKLQFRIAYLMLEMLRSKDAVVLRMLRLAVELHLLGTARFIAAQRWGQ